MYVYVVVQFYPRTIWYFSLFWCMGNVSYLYMKQRTALLNLTKGSIIHNIYNYNVTPNITVLTH